MLRQEVWDLLGLWSIDCNRSPIVMTVAEIVTEEKCANDLWGIAHFRLYKQSIICQKPKITDLSMAGLRGEALKPLVTKE